MKSHIKSNVILEVILLFTVCISIGGCYLTEQGSYIAHYQQQARDVNEIMQDSTATADVKQFLALVADIRRYAADSLGLDDNDNYTTFVSTDRTYLIDVVSACQPDTFEAYTWWYPFFGSFPYRGFFEKEDALEEAGWLKQKGLDVSVRKSDAFSTLGFYSDPLYSYMKDYSVFQIAYVIIHEQTHATIFLKNQIEFNEQLATFTGTEGAFSYIRNRFKENSQEFEEAIADTVKDSQFRSFAQRLYKALDSLYCSGVEYAEKIMEKQRLITEAKERVIEEYGDSKFTRYIQEAEINNAYLLSYMAYNQHLDLFYKLYEQNNRDLPKTIMRLKSVKNFNDLSAK